MSSCTCVMKVSFKGVSVLILLCSYRVSNEELVCTSSALIGSIAGPQSGLVQVFIDDATINGTGMNFEYRDDPVYVMLTPQYTIPA